MMTIAPEFEEIRIVKKDQQKMDHQKRLDFLFGHLSLAIVTQGCCFLRSKGSLWSGMFILTERQKNKPFHGEPLERKKSATLGDNSQSQLVLPILISKIRKKKCTNVIV